MRKPIACMFLLALAACTGGVAAINNLTAQAAQDVQLLAGGLPAIETALQNAGTLTAAQAAKVQSGVSQAVAAAKTLAAQPAIPTNAPALQTFEASVNDVLAIAAVVAPAVPAVQAAEVILPLVEVGVNVVASQIAPQASAMDPATARMILRGAAR